MLVLATALTVCAKNPTSCPLSGELHDNSGVFQTSSDACNGTFLDPRIDKVPL